MFNAEKLITKAVNCLKALDLSERLEIEGEIMEVPEKE